MASFGGTGTNTDVPAGTGSGFEGGIATTDVEPAWQTTALPGWVVYYLIPLLTAGESWPKASESQLWALRVEYVQLMNQLVATLDPTSTAILKVNASLDSPAKPAIFKRLAELYDDRMGVVAKARQSFSYAQQTDYFARETQYSKLSINVAFWVTITAAFIGLVACGFVPLARLFLIGVGKMGATRIAMIMERLAMAAARPGGAGVTGRVSHLAGATTLNGNKFLTAALAFELFEEISEEFFIDAMAQYQQIKMGTRDHWDWKKTMAAGVGAAVGAVVGTKLGNSVSRYVNGIPGVGRLNRTAGDNPGFANAFRRYPGRALNAGLNNMVASPVGSFAANAIVYGQFAPPTWESLIGGGAAGAARAGTYSPFNEHVVRAVISPVSTLAGAFSDAWTSVNGGPGTGSGGSPTSDNSSGPTGPRPGSPDSGGAQSPAMAGSVPPQRVSSDLGGPGRTPAGSPGPVTDPGNTPPGRRGPQVVPQIDTNVPAPRTDDSGEPQQAPRTRPDAPQPDTAPTQRTNDDTGQPQSDQQNDNAQDAGTPPQATQPAETGTPQTATPEPGTPQASAPEASETDAQQTTSTPETDAQQTTGTPENDAQQTTGTPENDAQQTTGTPDTQSEPTTAESNAEPASQPSPSSPATDPQGNITTAAVVDNPTTPTAPAPAPQQPAAQPADQTSAPSLISRLIGRAPRDRSSYGIVSGRPIRGTRFVASGRAAELPQLSVDEALAAFTGEVRVSDLGPGITGWQVSNNTLIVQTTAFGEQHFRFQVDAVKGGRLGRTRVTDGSAAHPHDVTLAPGVSPDQVARLVLHEIADTMQARSHPGPRGLRRLLNLRGDRDECMSARESEHRFLTRQLAEADAADRPRIRLELDAVRRILIAAGRLNAPPAAAPPRHRSVAELFSRLRAEDDAVNTGMRQLQQALSDQIAALDEVEAEFQRRAAGGRLTQADMDARRAANEARFAYQNAAMVDFTATNGPGRATDFAEALRAAHRLYLQYQGLAAGLVPVSALSTTSPVQLQTHIADLRAAAAELRSSAAAAVGTPGVARSQRTAAASAARAARVYQTLLDRQGNLSATATAQLLRLGRTHEQHYRQTAMEALVPSATTTRLNEVHAALEAQVQARHDAAVAMRTAVEAQIAALVSAGDEQARSAQSYFDASMAASQDALAAIGRQDLEEARKKQLLAASLHRFADQQDAARKLAAGARYRHELVSAALMSMITGNDVDLDDLATRLDVAQGRLDAYREAIAKAPPPTPPAMPPSAPATPVAASEVEQFRARLRREVERFTEEEDHCTSLVNSHLDQASEAMTEVAGAHADMAKAIADQDEGSEERHRKAEAAADLANVTARHHQRIARAYLRAAAAAEAACNAAELLLETLDGVTTLQSPTPQVWTAVTQQLATAAAYDTARQAAVPPMDAITGTLPAGPIADVAALTRAVNKMLKDNGYAKQFTVEEMSRIVRQAFRRVVSPGGVVLRLNVGPGAELRIRLRLDGLTEIADPDTQHSQGVSGHLAQGGGSVSWTGKHSVGASPALDLAKIASMLPSEHVRAIAPFVVLKGEAGWSANSAVTNSAAEFSLTGGVEDNRGAATMFEASASWDVQLRTTKDDQNPPRVLIDCAENQRIWVSHAYTETQPEALMRLEESERGKTPFPEYVVTGLTNLPELADAVAAHFRGGDLADVARDQIFTMMTQDLPSALRNAISEPGGFSRPITVNGQVRAVIQITTEVDEDVTPVGIPSTKHHQERLRVGFSQSGVSHSSGSGRRGGGTGGLQANLDASEELAELLNDQSPKATGGFSYNWGRGRSAGASSTAIHPSVQRWAGHTQGYMLNMRHTVTIQIAGQEPVTVTLPMPCSGLFRIPEPHAYRYGLPVDAEAAAGQNPDGSTRLRDDPTPTPPPGKLAGAPVRMGDPDQRPGHMRGAGMALVEDITGMDTIRKDVVDELRKMGLLPEIRQGIKHYSTDPRTMASQVINEGLIEQLADMSTETGYNLAAQEGIFISLSHSSRGRATTFYTLRVQLRQRWDLYDFQGATSAEHPVNLAIDSAASSGSTDRSGTRSVPVSVGNKGQDVTGLGLGGYGVTYTHGNSLQTSQSRTAVRNNVGMTEADSSASGVVPHEVRADLLSGDNFHPDEPLATGSGSARILSMIGMMPDAKGRPEGPAHQTSQEALRRALITHGDFGNLAEIAAGLFPEGLFPNGIPLESPQFHALAAHLNIRTILSHPEVFFGGHRTGIDVQPVYGETTQTPVTLKLTPGDSRYLCDVDAVNGDINLTLAALGLSRTTTKRDALEGNVGAQLPGTPGIAGKVGGAKSTTTTRETKNISGPERLGIDTGKQYVFAMDVTGEMKVGFGPNAQTATLDNGTALYVLPERDALNLYADGELELPMHKLADAAERVINGNLQLSRRVAVKFMNRYLEESGAQQHSIDKCVNALIKFFPASGLGALMPPGAPPGPRGETVAQVRTRIVQHADPARLLAAMLQDAQRLENGEVAADVADVYQDGIGMTTVRRVRLHTDGQPDTEVDLVDAIMSAVDELVPGALDQDSELWRALTGEYCLDEWFGKIDNMLDPDSPPGDFSLRIDGVEERISVTVKAELDGEIAYLGDLFNLGQILQLYTMLERNVSQTSSVTGSPTFNGENGLFSAAATTDKGGSTTGSSNMQETRIQGVAIFKDAEGEVRQGIRLSIEVGRVTNKLSGPRTVSRQLSGRLDRVIPAGMFAQAGSVPAPAVAPPDPRPTPIPEGFATERTTARGLVDAIVTGAENLLGRKLTREERNTIASQVTGNGRNAFFERMTDEGGFALVPIPKGRREEIVVRVRAKTTLEHVTAEKVGDGEVRIVDRREYTTRVSAERVETTPLGIGGNVNEPHELGGLGGNALDQAADNVATKGGNRDETSVFEKGDLTWAKYRVDYDVFFDVVSVTDDGSERVTRTVADPNAAVGDARLIQFDHHVAAANAQAETAPTGLPPLVTPMRTAPVAPMSMAGLYATTGASDHLGLAAALADQGPLIHLAGDLTAAPYGQITQARLLARELGVDVLITVQGYGGAVHGYRATPGGELHGTHGDRNFTPNLATVPPALIDLADSHGIDLRALHERTNTQAGTLADHLRNALSRRAIPLPGRPAAPWPVATRTDDSEWMGGSYHGGPGGAVYGRQIPGTGFVADGRADDVADLTVNEARNSFDDLVMSSDFGDQVLYWTWVAPDTVHVATVDGADLYFRVSVGPVEGGRLGRTDISTDGTAADPFLTRLAPRVAPDQVARLLLHEISDTLQALAGDHDHAHVGQAEGGRNECATARRNELRFLTRLRDQATTLEEADALQAEIDGVRAELQAITGTSPPANDLDRLLNWGDDLAALGISGTPEPLGDGTFKVTLEDGTPAMLLEFRSTDERDLQLALTRLGEMFGLGFPEVRTAGDRHLLAAWAPEPVPTDLTTREAVLIGYFDSLVGVHGRTTQLSTNGNGQIIPLVKPATLLLPEDGDTLTRLFYRGGWRANPLTPQDAVSLGRRLAAAKGEFIRLGQESAFELLMKRHQDILIYAAGLDTVVNGRRGGAVRLADVSQLVLMDAATLGLMDTNDLSPMGAAIDPVARLAENVANGIVRERTSALGTVVTFTDGSQAIRCAAYKAGDIKTRAWIRHALGLSGPAFYEAPDGKVYRTFGSDLLRASVATGIGAVVTMPTEFGVVDAVRCNDGRWAVRHVFDTPAQADEHEALLDETHAARDGEQGTYRAGPTVLYEHRLRPANLDPGMWPELASRALYLVLSHGGQFNDELYPSLLVENPVLTWFGQDVGRTFFIPGARVLSHEDIAMIAERIEAVRWNFEFAGLTSEYERMLTTLDLFTEPGPDPRPLGMFTNPATPEYRAPAWVPSAELLPGLLEGDHLWQLNNDPRPELMAQVENELAVRAGSWGHVSAWVPESWVTANVRPGAEVTFSGVVEGVDDPAYLGDRPRGVRLTIKADDYVPVSELSGKPHHAVFRPGARFKVLAVQENPRHLFLIQMPAVSPVEIEPPTRRPILFGMMARILRDNVQQTDAGVRLHGDEEAPQARPIAGAFLVECHYRAERVRIGDELIEGEELAAILLNCPGLKPDDVILLGGDPLGLGPLPQLVARHSGHVVIAAEGPIDITPEGEIRPKGQGHLPGRMTIHLPDLGATMKALRWLRDNAAPETAPRLLEPRLQDLVTEHRQEVRAGLWYRAADIAAAPTADPRLLHPTWGVIDVAVTGDGTGFLVGSQWLSAADFATMLAHDPLVLNSPAATLRILGNMTALHGPVLQQLADITGRTVLAADQIVYIGADRQPHTAAVQEYTEDGRPVFPGTDNGRWRQAEPRNPAPQSRHDLAAEVRAAESHTRPGLTADLFHAAVNADESQWAFLKTGSDGVVQVLRLPDGRAVVRKTFTARHPAEMAATEVLVSKIGRMIGANVPDVRQHPQRLDSVLMEFVPGRIPSVTEARSHRDAVLLELLDVLILNEDRHRGNALLGDALFGFDHARTLRVRRAMLGYLHQGLFFGAILRLDAHNRVVWADNPLTPQDVDHLSGLLNTFRPEFERSRRIQAYEIMMDRLYQIGLHARGTIPLIAHGGPITQQVQHHFGVRP